MNSAISRHDGIGVCAEVSRRFFSYARSNPLSGENVAAVSSERRLVACELIDPPAFHSSCVPVGIGSP
jgi:hypothetical protein